MNNHYLLKIITILLEIVTTLSIGRLRFATILISYLINCHYLTYTKHVVTTELKIIIALMYLTNKKSLFISCKHLAIILPLISNFF
jgi:hypothetical protein